MVDNNVNLDAHVSIFTNEQIRLLINERLALEAEFVNTLGDGNKLLMAWQRVYNQITTKDPKMLNFTMQQIQDEFCQQVLFYQKFRGKKVVRGNLFHSEIFKQFDEAYGYFVSRKRVYSHEQRQVVLDARIKLEEEFQQCDGKRTHLWQKLIEEIQQKATSTANLSVYDVRLICRSLMSTYRKQAKKPNKSGWCFFKQMHKVYGKHPQSETKTHETNVVQNKNKTKATAKQSLMQLVVHARLSRKAEFENASISRHRELWQCILNDIKTKATFGTKRLTSCRLSRLFSSVLNPYEYFERNQCTLDKTQLFENRNVQFYKQFERVNGNCVELETIVIDDSDDDDEMMLQNSNNLSIKSAKTAQMAEPSTELPAATEGILQFLTQKAAIERKLFQKILNFKKQKLRLLSKEIVELRKLQTILKRKKIARVRDSKL